MKRSEPSLTLEAGSVADQQLIGAIRAYGLRKLERELDITAARISSWINYRSGMGEADARRIMETVNGQTDCDNQSQ